MLSASISCLGIIIFYPGSHITTLVPRSGEYYTYERKPVGIISVAICDREPHKTPADDAFMTAVSEKKGTCLLHLVTEIQSDLLPKMRDIFAREVDLFLF